MDENRKTGYQNISFEEWADTVAQFEAKLHGRYDLLFPPQPLISLRQQIQESFQQGEVFQYLLRLKQQVQESYLHSKVLQPSERVSAKKEEGLTVALLQEAYTRLRQRAVLPDETVVHEVLNSLSAMDSPIPIDYLVSSDKQLIALAAAVERGFCRVERGKVYRN